MQNAECRMQMECRMQNAECRIMEVVFRFANSSKLCVLHSPTMMWMIYIW